MVPAAVRMRRSASFAATVRGGARAATPAVVVHLRATESSTTEVGFVVSRQVGGAVVRNRARRRLRHLVRGRLHQLPPGSRLVVRALPPSATSSAPDLSEQFAAAFERALRRAVR